MSIGANFHEVLDVDAEALSSLKQRMASYASSPSFTESRRWAVDVALAPPPLRVLEVGPGDGADTAVLLDEGCAVACVDLDADVLALSAAAGAMPAISDGAALCWRSGLFDAAVCNRVLQHTADPVGVLCELARVCRAGAVIAATFPDHSATTVDAPQREFDEFVAARLVPGAVSATPDVAAVLADGVPGLEPVAVQRWVVHDSDVVSAYQQAPGVFTALEAQGALGAATADVLRGWHAGPHRWTFELIGMAWKVA